MIIIYEIVFGVCGAFRCQVTSRTFALPQEVSPEGDDGRLPVQPLLLLGEADGEQLTHRLSREPVGRFTENTAEQRREELHLDHMTGPHT